MFGLFYCLSLPQMLINFMKGFLFDNVPVHAKALRIFYIADFHFISCLPFVFFKENLTIAQRLFCLSLSLRICVMTNLYNWSSSLLYFFPRCFECFEKLGLINAKYTKLSQKSSSANQNISSWVRHFHQYQHWTK